MTIIKETAIPKRKATVVTVHLEGTGFHVEVRGGMFDGYLHACGKEEDAIRAHDAYVRIITKTGWWRWFWITLNAYLKASHE